MLPLNLPTSGLLTHYEWVGDCGGEQACTGGRGEQTVDVVNGMVKCKGSAVEMGIRGQGRIIAGGDAIRGGRERGEAV